MRLIKASKLKVRKYGKTHYVAEYKGKKQTYAMCGVFNLKQLNQWREVIRAFDERNSHFWYCRLCRKNLPSSDYCMENHFMRKHSSITPLEKMEFPDSWNWSCEYEKGGRK